MTTANNNNLRLLTHNMFRLRETFKVIVFCFYSRNLIKTYFIFIDRMYKLKNTG